MGWLNKKPKHLLHFANTLRFENANMQQSGEQTFSSVYFQGFKIGT